MTPVASSLSFGEPTRYMNIRRWKRIPFHTVLSNRLRAQPQPRVFAVWLLPSLLLSLICSLGRMLTAPEWILYSIVCILQRPSTTAGLHRRITLVDPESKETVSAHWPNNPREDHNALQTCKCAPQTSAAFQTGSVTILDIYLQMVGRLASEVERDAACVQLRVSNATCFIKSSYLPRNSLYPVSKRPRIPSTRIS